MLVGGWATPLKNMKVNWDDEIPNINGKIKLMFQTTNQLLMGKLTYHFVAGSSSTIYHWPAWCQVTPAGRLAVVNWPIR